jgi:chaperone required for assembly of F1-ATPase
MVVTDGKVDLDLEALLIRLEMLLPMEPVMTGSMPMKEDVKTATDGACDNRKHADGEEVHEDFIIIEADREIDRC